MDEWAQSVRSMLEWIDETIGDNVTLSDLSRQIGYSPYYCTTLFHAFTGLTIRTYTARRRLYRAFWAIHTGERRLLDIALEHGYQSHEAMTRAFTQTFGHSPAAHRKLHRYSGPPSALLGLLPANHEKGALYMVTKTNVRVEYIPAHKYLGIYSEKATRKGKIWPGHDCDAVTSLVQSMANLGDPIVTAHTAGWRWDGDKRDYFYGLGLPIDYDGAVPEGFELKEIPASYYLVFSHPPFVYPTENSEVMQTVEAIAWSFDPATMGYRWNEELCQDYQRHYPEGLGYQVLRPVLRRA